MDEDKSLSLTKDVSTDFVDRKIQPALYDKTGKIKRSLWEMGLSIAIKDSFRSGDIFLPESNKHVSFWDLIYKEKQWEKEKEKAYKQLALEKSPTAIKELTTFLIKRHLQYQRKF